MIKNLLLLVMFFTGNLLIFSQSCSINAGNPRAICGTSTTLAAVPSGPVSTTTLPTWTIISKPAGAPDPTFSDANAYNPTVNGMTFPGDYVFRITQPCTSGPAAFSQITITSPGAITGFTAGPDITNIPATTGVAALSATVPNGYTPSWTFYHIYSFQFNGTVATTNASMSDANTATPTLTLGNKATHQVDPAYRAVLRITSTVNPSCWYEDTIDIRFIPNPLVLYDVTQNQCVPSGTTGDNFYIDPLANSPRFSTATANSAGNPTFGTTVSMTAVSQPSGGNIQYSRMVNGRLHFSGITAVGPYVFDLTVSNITGSTTLRITYNFNGNSPNQISFLDPAHPNQMQVYSSSGSGGAVYCSSLINSATPITYYFKIDPADPANTLVTVSSTGQIPGGTAAPGITQNGTGMMNRNVVVTPPAGGWKAGTYKFNMIVGPTGCSRSQDYFIHISDSGRPSVNVNNIAVCYSGSGQVSATIPLPAIYQEVATNLSYFQGFSGRYEFTLVSSPAGAATPAYQAASFRTLKSTSTVISNLNKEGEYVFKIRAFNGNGAGQFLEAEYACSGTSIEDTFSIFVTTQVNSNAGSDQNVISVSSTTLNGNNPGVVATGIWSLVSKPVGAVDPVIVTPSAYNSSVTGLNSIGAYTFRWTVATGTCTNFDDMVVNHNAGSPGGVQSGLSYWYRADMNAANTGVGTDVTGWTDVWNGTTVAQLGTNALPKYVVGTSSYFNFNPGINFTAVTQTLGNMNVQTVSALGFDIFTLTKENILGNANNNRLFSSLVDNSLPSGSISRWDGIGLMTDQGYPNNIERVNNAYGARYLANPGNISRSTTIPSIMYHRFTDLTVSKGLNGAGNGIDGTYTTRGLMNGGHAFGDTRFSSNGSDNGGFTGHIGETIIYGAGNLTVTERRKVDSYLAIKYGITLGQVATDHYLDTDGNIVWNGATNTSYNNNIFGVSRDDIEVFAQKVSKSVNTGTILTVATINDFVNPNLAAARTGFVNDKTYFLLGDNNVVATPVLDITVAGNAWKRIQRVWLSQRKNTPGALYFEADLSTYGTNFTAASTVWMLVADDAAFTTNVQSVPGTYTNGKWVFSKNFDADNVQRYITFAGLAPSYCVSGDCNPNTFLNTTNPNTIEYDNMVSTFHSTRMRDPLGNVFVWGEKMANNGIGNLLVPTLLNNINYPALTGDILKFTGGSSGKDVVQSVVLTTTGLFAWGQEGILISNNLTTNATFQKIAVGTYGVNAGATKADGLPDGVAPADVKMLFGTYNTLALTTCSGEAWVLALDTNLYGDNSGSPATNNQLWHRVHTNATTTLDNVVAIRGNGWRMLMALTATGEVYTWGGTTRLGNGSATAARVFATQMTLPAGVTPKMIGVTSSSNVLTPTNYILGTNSNVYALGENSRRQLGNFTTTNSNSWVQVQKSATAGDYLTNVVWISPNEHDQINYGSTPLYMMGSINVLTTNGRLWAWGVNDGQMLGGPSNNPIDPTEMPGSIPSANPYDIGKLNWTDKVIAVETGGHTSMIVKDNSKKYGYVGHRVNGSMGDGTSTDVYETEYNFASTPVIDLCGAPAEEGVCYKPGIAGIGLDTKVGITSLSRAGATDTDNWPMTRKGGWIALESQTKGFVPNRVAFNALGNPIGIPPADFVEGMMVFDTINKCMKMYTSMDGGATYAWYCLSTQTCTDIIVGTN